MDRNSDDGSWIYDSDQWMDSSLFHPISDDDEPMIELMEGTETETQEAASHFLVDCGEMGETAFLAFPSIPTPTSSSSSPPPSRPLNNTVPADPQSSTPPSLPLNSTVTAAQQSSPPPAIASGSRNPKQRNINIKRAIRKTKDKPIPKYMLDPNEPGITEKEKQTRLHARKCKQERMKKAEEKQFLKKEHDRLVIELANTIEKLEAERAKMMALENEIERRGQIILALSVNDHFFPED